ncbi:ubiquitin family protein [Chryseobacterium oryzae]|uniref:Uncharacterized protein n=1 Tax=Chryseobacterium oryzae TaxID=2929799 RepID=A0ABY4BCW9_9FLAO|nr:hypothetical protein [Chryseobacterium oryzae]UOE36994.1 hypothetical protein MTP08_07910 [Chryseobacterium oryzae]
MISVIDASEYIHVALVYQTRYIMNTSNATAYLLSAFLLQKIADVLEQSQIPLENPTG